MAERGRSEVSKRYEKTLQWSAFRKLAEQA
jgi:hypothetical protein